MDDNDEDTDEDMFETSLFRCGVSDCQTIFGSKEGLFRHLDLHMTDPTIECGTDGCIDMFCTESQRNRHQMEIHSNRDDNSDGVNEDMCDNSCDSNGLALGSDGSEDSKDYCVEPMKDKAFHSVQEMVNEDIHSKRQHICDNENCGQEFRSRLLLNRHLLSVHNISSAPTERFGDDMSDHLVIEILRHNKSERDKYFDFNTKAFICPINECHKSYGTDRIFYYHLTRAHASRQYVCTHEGCGKAYKAKQHLKEHLLTHNTIESFRCPHNGCDYKAVCNKRLRNHLRRVNHSKGLSKRLKRAPPKTTREWFTCDIIDCRQTFISPDDLKSHTLSHRIQSSGEEVAIDKEMASNEAMADILRQNRSQRQNYFDLTVNAFICPINDCHKSYDTDEAFADHLWSVHCERPHICGHEGCGKAFKTINALTKHLETHKTKSIECKYNGCQYKCISDHYLKLHMKSHTKTADNKPIYRYACDVTDCHKSYVTYSGLFLHRRSHMAEPAFKCGVDGCTDVFRTGGQRHRHRMAVHNRPNYPSRRVRRCDWPGCDFVGRHMHKHKHRGKHTGRPHACDWPDCDKRYVTARGLSYHTVSHNINSDNQYTCYWPGCEYTSTNSRNVGRHVDQVHTKIAWYYRRTPRKPTDRQFVCDDCGKRFKSTQGFVGHKKLHQTERFQECGVDGCADRFKTNGQLRKHRVTVHHWSPKPRINRRIRCDLPQCDWFGFNLPQHKRVVHNVVPDKRWFVCDWPECGKRYAAKPALTDHINVHKNLKPYACDWPACQYRAAHKPNVRLHKKYVHKI
ncbi:unnamed protein product [Medioppia subpectinata]|uniref:C2H2-type domain-containing protein n=1 Tax=Medioppia subpectinata TaxID=1979941 RepID=A0A7R9PYC3_9ACAR|nr:unnamed protein product [Medioppia subpectinata]CAG2104921.1 unnamed protein product [Medioppia subpectinata]